MTCPRIVGIGPSLVGDQRRPMRPGRILIVRIIAETLIKLAVFPEFFAIQLYAKPRLLRHTNCAVFIFHQAAFDDVVGKLMVVGIRRECQSGNDSAEVQHCRQLNSEFTG